MTRIRTSPIAGEDDVSCAIALTRLVWDELEAYGTAGGERLKDAEIELAHRALKAVLERIGITLSLPWRNFSGFRSYWLKNDGYGSWQARRDLLGKFFEPVQEELDRQEEALFRAVVAEAVSPQTRTGWPKVDEEVSEPKRRFRTATTTQDYRDVGNRCVAVLELADRACRYCGSGELVCYLATSWTPDLVSSVTADLTTSCVLSHHIEDTRSRDIVDTLSHHIVHRVRRGLGESDGHGQFALAPHAGFDH
ncbi:hypothetical protein M3E00_16500 [Dietzia cinnamea]|uniref:hypothetical protein n=1 Tax=Dietzia cinnamea TaxID=321318 RepID=UPI0021A8AE73|nr:hypothetical protein [Dietzia cinnamea]MCT2100163.1 hypothetical protein [Dietzia cinnamea]